MYHIVLLEAARNPPQPEMLEQQEGKKIKTRGAFRGPRMGAPTSYFFRVTPRPTTLTQGHRLTNLLCTYLLEKVLKRSGRETPLTVLGSLPRLSANVDAGFQSVSHQKAYPL